MKQKLFTILTLLLCLCSGAWAQDPTPGEANSTYLDISKYETIDEAGGFAGVQYLYFYNTTTNGLFVPVYAAHASKSAQKWITSTTLSSSPNNSAWSASDPYKGGAYYKGNNSTSAKQAKIKSGETITFKVSNCTKVGIFGKAGGSSSKDLIVNIYELDSELNIDGDAVETINISSTSDTKKESGDLSASKKYAIVITGQSSGTAAYAYEIAFYTPAGGGSSKTETSRTLTGINISGSAWDISGLSDNAATVTTAYDHVPTVQFVYTINYDDSSSDTGQTEDAVPAKSGDNYVTTSTELTTNVTLTFTNVTNQFLFKMTDVTGVLGTVGDNIDSDGKVIKSKSATVEASFNNVGGTSAIVYNGGSGNAALVDQYHQINLGNSGNSYFKASFATPLEAGDIITCSSEGKTFYINATSSKSSSVVTLPYTVTSSDALVGTTDVYVWKDNRNGAENPGNTFTSFTIKRNTKHTVTYAAGEGSGDVPASFEWPEEGKFTVASGDNLTPPANKLFDCWNDGSNDYAAGATYTMGTSNVTLTAKYKDPNVLFAAGEGSGTMNAQAHDAGDIFNLPNSTFTVPTDCKFVNWLCSVDGQTYAAGAPYTMTDEVTTFTAQYESILGTMIIKATATGRNVYSASGTLAGTATGGNMGSTPIDGGYKFAQAVAHITLTLDGDYKFRTGDIINVHVTNAADNNSKIKVYDPDNKDENHVWFNSETPGVVGDNKFVLPSTVNGKSSISVCRTSSNGWNAYVDYIEVTRPAIVTLNASGYATYSAASDFEIYSGAKAYKAALNISDNKITCSEIEGKVPAGAGVLLYGDAGATVALLNTTGATALEGNDLKGTTTASGSLATLDGAKFYYALSGDTFKHYTGAAFVAGKAYFESDTELNSKAFAIVFDSETTAINGVEEVAPKTMKTRKVVKNGRLVIETANGEYSVSGARVK